MKRALSMLAFVTLVLVPTTTSALCQLAFPRHATLCHTDMEGACCWVKVNVRDATCFEGWCHDYAECRWERTLGPLCV